MILKRRRIWLKISKIFTISSAVSKISHHSFFLRCIFFIEVILVKDHFLALSFEKGLVLLNFILIIPTPVVDMIIVKIFLFYIWNKCWLYCFCFKTIPIEVFEPRMRFHFFASLHSKPLSRLSLQAFIHEVCSLFRIPVWKIFVFDLSLLI